MPRLLISAAHTLENPGEIFGELREADLTRKIVQKTLPYLDQHRIEYKAVPLDLQLLKRIEWINNTGFTKEQGDIFVEIHVNDGGKQGIEGWYEGSDTPDNLSKKLTDSLVSGISKQFATTNQGIKSEYQHELGSLIILNQTNPIATAIECLYIDNPEDIKLLKDDSKLDLLAKSIADSINDYLKNVAPKLDYNSTPKATKAEDDLIDPFASSNPFGPANGFFGNNPAPSAPIPTNPSGFNFGANTSANKPSTPAPLMMDRDQRKKMIEDVYQKVYGEEAPQTELNLNLNLGVTEVELIKKLIEDKKHIDILENAKQYKTLKNDFEKIKSELENTKANISDSKLIQDSLYKIIEQKNRLIIKMQQELTQKNIIPKGGHIDSITTNSAKFNNFASSTSKKKKTFSDFLMQIFRL